MIKDLTAAEARWLECLDAARQAGTNEVLAMAVSGLGDVGLLRGDLEQAAARFTEALALNQELGFTEHMADMCLCLAAVANAEEDGERTARCSARATRSTSRSAAGSASRRRPTRPQRRPGRSPTSGNRASRPRSRKAAGTLTRSCKTRCADRPPSKSPRRSARRVNPPPVRSRTTFRSDDDRHGAAVHDQAAPVT